MDQEFSQTQQAITLGYFNSATDLLALHYDSKSDLDDTQAMLAAKMVLQYHGIDAMFVLGTCGGTGGSGCGDWNPSGKVVTVANVAFPGGPCDSSSPTSARPCNVMGPNAGWNKGWLNAGDEWGGNNATANVVKRAAERWKAKLDAGGKVYIAEGGMGDFTQDVATYAQNTLGVSAAVLETRVISVQHSTWNISNSGTGVYNNYTTEVPENYAPGGHGVMPPTSGPLQDQIASWRINDGNGPYGGWGTDETTDPSRSNFFNAARATGAPYKAEWDAVNTVGWTTRVDFSDTVELMYILNLHTPIKTGAGGYSPDQGQVWRNFLHKYNVGGPAATCSDGIQNQGETGTDCGGPCTACSSGSSALPLNASFTSGADGFTYSDNLFRGTNNAGFADGVYGSGKLNVTVGGMTTASVPTSGGWSRNFTTSSSGTVSVSFKYSMTTDAGIDPGEWVETLVMIDNTLYGVSPNDYVQRIEDGGNQVEVTRTFTSNSLSAGTHTIKLGAYMNSSTASNEVGTITIDDVSITASSGGGSPTYVGCFADASTRDLPYLAFSGQNNSGAICAASCQAAGYTYAGTQYGNQCYCGNSYGSQGTSANCTVDCQGNVSEKCGGAWANSVWSVGGGSPPAATCSDGIQNQGETGIDCGGPCTACGGGSTNVWLEAECATTKTGGYATVYTAEPGYTGTGYLMSVADTTVSPPSCTDRATYTVNAAVAGAHSVWFRASNNNTGADNSLFYRVNGGTWVTMNPVTAVATGFFWGKLASTTSTLNAGSNTLEICNRENGLEIDKIYVTSTTTTPSGTGSAATNCP